MSGFLGMIFTADFLFSVFRISTPIILGTLAAYISGQAGLGNIAIEGMMLVAALLGVLFSASLGNAWLALIVVILIGAMIGFAIGYLSEVLKADIFLTGIAFNLIAAGFTVFLLFVISGDRGISANVKSLQLPSVVIPVIKDIPFLGEVVSGHNVLTYFSFLSVVLLYIFINKTKIGLRIRAVGENELAAKSVGIKTLKLKLLSISISGGLAAIGGCYLSMGYLSMFTKDMSAGRGFIAFSANAMSGGSVLGGMLVSLLFGLADTMTNFAQQFFDVPYELLSTTPYIFVIIALVVYNISKNNKTKKNLLK